MTKARIRKAGANVVVQAFGEVLMLPGGDVNRWNRRFVAAIRRETIAAAPTNKRPRWAHYGKPLKSTIKTSKPNFRKSSGGARLYAAVGSTAPHAYYVDQGTGVYNGSGPYPAAILPPWVPGGASLYESTWRPQQVDENGDIYHLGRRVAPVMIKGQKPQQFMDKGLTRAFAFMRLQRSVASPAKIGLAEGSEPTGTTGFLGNTIADGAFLAQLAEWRSWRDEAWNNHTGLGRGGGIGSPAQRQFYRDFVREHNAEVRSRSADGLTPIERYRANLAETAKRRAKEDAKARAAVARKEKSEKRQREKEEAERERILRERLLRNFRRVFKDANRFALEIERAGNTDVVLKKSKNKTLVRVQWIDSHGEVQHHDFR